jgi:hypothetical protein
MSPYMGSGARMGRKKIWARSGQSNSNQQETKNNVHEQDNSETQS